MVSDENNLQESCNNSIPTLNSARDGNNLYALGKAHTYHVLHPVSQEFPQCFLSNGYNVGLIKCFLFLCLSPPGDWQCKWRNIMFGFVPAGSAPI